jgi:protein-L-isoaspartate(D-aspartate) O-methyltransferase
MTDFSSARKNMVDGQIHTAGVINEDILNAFRNVPRETFVPEALQKIAYSDEEIALGGGRYLPAPIAHSRMLQAAMPESNDKVLDIGGGTGYPAAILSRFVGRVVALEEEPQFLEYAAQVWSHAGLTNVSPVIGPLGAGHAGQGPYNIIFIHGAVPELPMHLAEQLAPGGRMVAIVQKPGLNMGQATLVVNSVANKFSSRVLFDAWSHYLPPFEPRPAFVFNN